MSGIWWAMSFAEPKPPHGRGWLGGVVTEADTLVDAITWTHIRGINPGGSVQSVCFRSVIGVDSTFVDRLITDRDEWKSWPPPDDVEVVEATEQLIGKRPVW